MITTSKVDSSFMEKLRLVLKVFQFGGKTAVQISPFGIDSRPLDKMKAIYAETSNADEALIIGYINENYVTEKGEIRLYSMDIAPQGGGNEVKSTIYLKNDGKIELNGGGQPAVLGNLLQSALLDMQIAINQELTKISAGITTAKGSYIVVPINVDLTNIISDTIELS